MSMSRQRQDPRATRPADFRANADPDPDSDSDSPRGRFSMFGSIVGGLARDGDGKIDADDLRDSIRRVSLGFLVNVLGMDKVDIRVRVQAAREILRHTQPPKPAAPANAKANANSRTPANRKPERPPLDHVLPEPDPESDPDDDNPDQDQDQDREPEPSFRFDPIPAAAAPFNHPAAAIATATTAVDAPAIANPLAAEFPPELAAPAASSAADVDGDRRRPGIETATATTLDAGPGDAPTRVPGLVPVAVALAAPPPTPGPPPGFPFQPPPKPQTPEPVDRRRRRASRDKRRERRRGRAP